MSIQTIPRRLPEVGRLRLGQRLPAGNGTRPAALAAWRLTSKSRFRLEAAARQYGGIVQEWKDAPGEDQQWELFTESKSLRVAVIPSYNPDGTMRSPVSQFYEYWSAGGCQRRCDGATELISGDGCLCQMECDEPSEYKCKPTTRLSVLLPDLPGLGVWRVETHGYYGAAELAASAELLASLGRPMPVALVIDQRSEKRPGQPRRDYVVPMLDSRQSFMDLQALAAADPVTGEISPAGRPAIEQSDPGSSDGRADGVGDASPGASVGSPGSDQTSEAGGKATMPAGPPAPAPDPNVPTPEQEATAGRSGVEGANHSRPGDGSPNIATTPPESARETGAGQTTGRSPGRRSSGGLTSSRSAGPGKPKADRDDPEQADLDDFEQGLVGDDPRRFTR